ncbi:MAG TPA: hypothetical protein VK280_03445 [Streptosporangiaceae bacterium]|nr:hypothetical protein [Streptosporangiaceae bacterium]
MNDSCLTAIAACAAVSCDASVTHPGRPQPPLVKYLDIEIL